MRTVHIIPALSKKGKKKNNKTRLFQEFGGKPGF
jgi:hypothetical protein